MLLGGMMVALGVTVVGLMVAKYRSDNKKRKEIDDKNKKNNT